MLAFTKAYIEKKGGKVVGDEYQPMDATDWTAIISKMRSANPDAVSSQPPAVLRTSHCKSSIRQPG